MWPFLADAELTALPPVVILSGMYVRTIKVRSSSGAVNEYVRVVEAYRDNGKVKQRVVADLGRKDVLGAVLPKLRRVLEGTPRIEGQAEEDVEVLDASTWGPVLVVRQLFEQLGLWSLFEEFLGHSRTVPYADRAFVLLANRLIRPRSEHGLASWLETDFVCDRQGRRFVPHWHQRGRVRVHHRQLGAWYGTLDRLVAAKAQIEVALYHRLRDLFCLQPDLVLYDITSTYFQGAGPPNLAKHGYSRDGKPHNVQVIVGVVMVGGWPIAHHVWAGNRVDHTTVQEVIADLRQRFSFARIVFVGDRGMVTQDNLDDFVQDGNGYLVGVKRRRNAKFDEYLERVDETKWIDCPGGITASEKRVPFRTRAQEVPSGEPGVRVFVIDSEERRQYEEAMRTRAMEKTRVKLEALQKRVAASKQFDAARVGAAAERIVQAHHGHRYYCWEIRGRAFHFQESPQWQREKRLEGKYVITTTEKDLDVLAAVQTYKDLTDVERGFRHLKDVLAIRPIYHQAEPRVRAHIFVAALALLLERLLERRLKEAGVGLSAPEAMEAVATVRWVTFRLPGQPLRHGVSGGSPHARQVLRALGISDLKPPTPPEDQTTVMQ
jgi:transposase